MCGDEGLPGGVFWPPTGLLLLPDFCGDCFALPATADAFFSRPSRVSYLHVSCDQPVLLIHCHSQTMSSQSTAAMLLWLLTACGWARMLLNPTHFYHSSHSALPVPLLQKYPSDVLFFSTFVVLMQPSKPLWTHVKKRTFRDFYVSFLNAGDLTHFIL